MFGGIMTPKSPISFSCGLILSPLQNLKVGKKKSKLLSWKNFVRIGRMGMNSVEMLVFRFFRRPNCYSDSWVKRTYWVELQTNFFTPSIPSQYYLSWTKYILPIVQWSKSNQTNFWQKSKFEQFWKSKM